MAFEDMNTHETEKRAFELVKLLNRSGHTALYAGGAARDIVMGLKPNDYDILTDASSDEIRDLFFDRKVKQVGKTFSVSMVDGIEVATCRRDLSGGSDSEPFPECDLALRDLTINSMAYDPIEKKVIDPFGGREDLQKRLIRFTGNADERIKEDPVRMVRACRFASMVQGDIDLQSLESIIKHRDLVRESTAPERIRGEIMKAMVYTKPSLFFRALHSASILELIFPSLSRCFNLDGGPHHGESVYEHCLMTGDALSPSRPLLRLAGYLHDTGKYDTAKIIEGRLTFIDHDNHSDAALNDLKRNRFSTEEVKYIDAVIKTHMRPLKADSTPRAVRRVLSFIKEYDINWQTFMQVRIADKASNLAKPCYSREDIKIRVMKIRQELKRGDGSAFSTKELAISGNDIMDLLKINPGPYVGRIMDHLLECVLDDPALNSEESLKKTVLEFYAYRDGAL